MPDLSGAHSLGGGEGDKSAKWPHRFHSEIQEPLSETLYNKFSKVLDENYDVITKDLDIIGLDVLWCGFTPHLLNGYTGYVMVLTCRGALLGPQFNLTNHRPVADFNMSVLHMKNELFESCKALRVAKASQAFPNGQPPALGLPS